MAYWPWSSRPSVAEWRQAGSDVERRLVGALGKTTWNLDFDLKLPENDSGGGLICGKS